MGTWGAGNFENDCAAEHVQELCSGLIAQIEKAVADPELLEPGEYHSQVMMANIEILACLSEGLGRFEYGSIPDMLYPVFIPPSNTVEQWKTVYLNVWDNFIDRLEPKADYRKQRRDVLVDSFDRLISAARIIEGDAS